jgi:hypothetical protein
MDTVLLRKCSITYLLLPNLLFSFGWFRQPYSFILLIGYAYLFYREMKKKNEGDGLARKDLFFLVLVAAVWTFFCGVDGLSAQSGDWLAHNAKFNDLYKSEWPLYFSGVDRYACYYFGYYLIPSVLSKLSGHLLPVIFVGWTFLGFLLGLSWIYLLINRSKWLVLVFLMMRGTGKLAIYMLGKLHIAQLAVPAFSPAIRSIFDQSTFVANQIIPALITCGIFAYDYFKRKATDESFFVITLAFVWAIFPAMVLMLVYLTVLINRYLLHNNWKLLSLRIFLDGYFLPGLLFLPTFIYFLSSQTIAMQGFIWQFGSVKLVALNYLSGIAIDLVVFYIVITVLNRMEKFFPFWLIHVLFAGIVLLSIYRIGVFNDLFTRGAIPLYILLFVCILRGLERSIRTAQWPAAKLFYPALIFMAVLAISSLTGKSLLLRDNVAVNLYLGPRSTYEKYAYDAYPDTYQTLLYGYKDREGAKQYLGAKTSVYSLYLSKTRI